jgi:uncharacterized protein (DUF2225 family)
MAKKIDTPLYIAKIECPICKSLNEFEVLKVGAYIEEGRDTDFCPKKRVWQNPSFQRYSPLLYFMATCTNCFYTREFTSKFKDWQKDTVFKSYKLKTQKEQHLVNLRSENGVLQKLGNSLDPTQYPFATAVNKMLLGIYDELFNRQCSNLDLGRYFLRISWLFRENSEGTDTTEDKLSAYAMKIEDVIIRLGYKYEQLKEDVDALKKFTGDLLKDNCLHDEAVKKELTLCYGNSLADLHEVIDKYKVSLIALKGSLKTSSNLSSGETGSSSPVDQPYMDYGSYREFLRELKEGWSEVPTSEREALNFAANYYKAAYENDKEISEGNQAIQAVYLIAELSRRVSNHDEAKRYFNTAIKLAQEYTHLHKGDKSRTALARKVRELALEQGRLNLETIEQLANARS